MIAEFFPKNDDQESQDISEESKNMVTEQRNIEAHEMFMITIAIQCQMCYHHAAFGHTCCTCGTGKANQGASDEDMEQVFKNVMICFEMHTASAFVFRTETSR